MWYRETRGGVMPSFIFEINVRLRGEDMPFRLALICFYIYKTDKKFQ